MTPRQFLLASILVVLGIVHPAIAVDYVKIPQDPTGWGYQAFPDVARLADGRLMTTFYSGVWHLSPPSPANPKGGRIDYSFSSDEGYTWSTPQVLYDGWYDEKDSSLTQLKNGQLIVSFYADPPASQGPEPYSSGVHIMTSANLGQTWSAPRQIYGGNYWITSPIRELSDGRLIAPLYYQTGSSASTGTAFGAVGISDDRGQTWSEPVAIPLPALPQEQWLCAETDIIELTNGNLYAAQRTNFASMFSSISTDRGATWSQSQALGFNGHCPYLHRTPTGMVLLGYRDYNGGGTSLRYSLDECETWSSKVLVDSVGGAYPSIVDLRDGTELITYYEEGSSSDIRVKRFRATADGIEWLPVVPSPEPGPIVLLATAALGMFVHAWRRNCGATVRRAVAVAEREDSL
jgi:sialidase-1